MKRDLSEMFGIKSLDGFSSECSLYTKAMFACYIDITQKTIDLTGQDPLHIEFKNTKMHFQKNKNYFIIQIITIECLSFLKIH